MDLVMSVVIARCISDECISRITNCLIGKGTTSADSFKMQTSPINLLYTPPSSSILEGFEVPQFSIFDCYGI